jgi:hypothetical protein
MATVFNDLITKGLNISQVPALTKEARNWYRSKAQSANVTSTKLLRQATNTTKPDMVRPGSMIMFFYDPKTKDKLPYYDKFPVIFPIEKMGDGFLGLNFHYLPYKMRALFMDALYDIATDTRYDDKTRIKISYERCKQMASLKFYKPTIKRYLNTHIRSRLIAVQATEWDIALFLPVERFAKANKGKVWRDSQRMLTK